MGSLRLPIGKTAALDTSVVVYSIERHPDFYPILIPLWKAVEDGTIRLTVSELVLLEATIHPLRHGNLARLKELDTLLSQPGVQLIPVTRPVIGNAAELRAFARLGVADAIHTASAILNSCDTFITNDGGLRSVPGLSVQVLSDFLTP